VNGIHDERIVRGTGRIVRLLKVQMHGEEDVLEVEVYMIEVGSRTNVVVSTTRVVVSLRLVIGVVAFYFDLSLSGKGVFHQMMKTLTNLLLMKHLNLVVYSGGGSCLRMGPEPTLPSTHGPF